MKFNQVYWLFFITLLLSSTIIKASSVTKLIINVSPSDRIQYVKVGYYINMLVELEPRNRIKKEVGIENQVSFDFELNEPQIFILTISDHSVRYKIYAVPGDTIFISMSKDYIEFKGDRIQENYFLLDHSLNLVNRPRLKFYNEELDSNYLSKLDNLVSVIKNDLEQSTFSADFSKFVKAECIGIRYYNIYNKAYKLASDTTAIDSLSTELREIIRSLFNIQKINETRSRYYINSLNGFMSLKVRNGLSQNQSENYFIKMNKIQSTRIENLAFSTDLLKVFLVGLSSSALYLAKNESQLAFAEYLISEYDKKYNTSQANAFYYIYSDLKKKKNRFNLNSVEDYCFETIKSDSIFISELFKNSDTVALYFWATWCRPCIEFLKSLPDSSNLNTKVAVINFWSEKENWQNSLDKHDLRDNFQHYFAHSSLTEVLKDEWSIDKLPFFIILNRDLSIQQFTSDKNTIKELLTK